MSLFRENSGKITLQPEIQKIDAFAQIIRRDKDKAKRNAHNELAFVYFWTDYKSPYLNNNEENRLARLRKDLRLGDDWKPDAAIKNAIDKYRELNETPAIRTLRTVKETLAVTVAVTESMRKKVEASLEAYNTGDETENSEDITVIIQAVTALITLSEKIPKTISVLGAMEEKVKTESADTKIYGGGKAGLFED
jgi:hypothetical protein